MTYRLFQIVKYLYFQDYDHFRRLIVFYFQEEMETKLGISYFSSSLGCVSLELILLLFFLLNLFIPFLKTKKIYKNLYLFYVCTLLFILVLVLLIEKYFSVFFFIFCLDKLSIKRYNKRFINFRVLIFNILFKRFFIEF